MSMKIIVPGPLTTLQDFGRYGYQASGFSPAGAADLDALKNANMLTGNAPCEAALEMNLSGITAQFVTDCVIAVTGGKMPVLINGNPAPMYRAIAVHKFDYLYCGAVSNGNRSYIAVAGGFDAEPVMGSRSTGVKFGVGGFDGRPLKSGDVIGFRAPKAILPHMEKRIIPDRVFPAELTVRAIPGPQAAKIGPEGLGTLFSSEYTVSRSADRMGIRLEGPAVPSADGYDIISDGTATGAVQISNDGTPIILLNDRQTTGGYAKPIGIISTDIPAVGQAIPGTKIRFRETTPEEAEKLAREKAAAYRSLYRRINGHSPERN